MLRVIDIFTVMPAIMAALFLFSCRDGRVKSDENYFAGQVGLRISHIKNMQGRDSLKEQVQKIHKHVNELILLSKDIENPGASVHLANSFFNEQAEKYNLIASDFREISKDHHMDEIAEALRQNELNLLNQLILKNDSSALLLYTAQ
jgi:hypothetical protein